MSVLIVFVTAIIGVVMFPKRVQFGRYTTVAVKEYILTEISTTLFLDGYPMSPWLSNIISVNNVATKNLPPIGETVSCKDT